MNAKKIIIIAIVAVFVALAATALIVKIEDVTITGNEWYTGEEIEDKILDSGRLSRTSAYQFVRQLMGKREMIPFVQDYKIVFDTPKSVEIIVYEKSIVGYVKYMGSYMYFDKDGIVVDSSAEPLAGIPEITGLRFGNIVLYKPIPVEDPKIFESILNLTQMLQNFGIKCDRIDYTGVREATLYLGNIKVVLGSDSEMNGKIAELNNMLPKIKAKMAEEGIQSGTLYLDNYDENANSTAYSFKKD